MIFKFNIYASFFFTFTLFFGVVYAQTEDQISEFAKAAKFNDAATVKSLISKGVSPNTVDPKGDPMLNLAIRDKSEDVINLLITNKATDVDLSNKSGETPLMIASINGDLPAVKALVLQRKAQIDHIGWTPLHYACARGHLDVAQFLIANGASIDSLSQGNTTPLMMAVQSGNEALVKLLLDKGADLQLRNSKGLSAIDIAVIYEKPWISEGLLSRWQKLYKQPYKWPKGVEPLKS
ncbi:ankyrin repeat domain-containing protein [Polynucleobacter sp. AP-Capit-er-40B-B4]|uniref:ankyrin repeat domain-containing protein n=1 Tax=Polynucleobacter sp. AP-Capit-er-40B-B4 TaxID=2576927 RepID=UPI001C0D62B3|nr:ankyrin repeat domain-containing protein [Polynucleobacter sp. AP-Capit-er-40B-B4]MBU3582129.1 ankyrin repeat domain-containing protein [Polynucleobacter sp. AP-Capit-er-40B-B4]